LFFILLGLKASLSECARAYGQLQTHFRPWVRLVDTTPEQVEAVLKRGGIGSVKARVFVDIARRLHQDFGFVSLQGLQAMTDREAETYLLSLPGVGIKTARWILLYCFGRAVFPVDAHTYRVGLRLGIVPTSKSARAVHAAFDAVIPSDLREVVHANF